jgi:hypothetical protein
VDLARKRMLRGIDELITSEEAQIDQHIRKRIKRDEGGEYAGC